MQRLSYERVGGRRAGQLVGAALGLAGVAVIFVFGGTPTAWMASGTLWVAGLFVFISAFRHGPKGHRLPKEACLLSQAGASLDHPAVAARQPSEPPSEGS